MTSALYCAVFVLSKLWTGKTFCEAESKSVNTSSHGRSAAWHFRLISCASFDSVLKTPLRFKMLTKIRKVALVVSHVFSHHIYGRAHFSSWTQVRIFPWILSHFRFRWGRKLLRPSFDKLNFLCWWPLQRSRCHICIIIFEQLLLLRLRHRLRKRTHIQHIHTYTHKTHPRPDAPKDVLNLREC